MDVFIFESCNKQKVSCLLLYASTRFIVASAEIESFRVVSDNVESMSRKCLKVKILLGDVYVWWISF